MDMTHNNLCTVVGLPDMIDDFKEIFKDATPVVYYDTRFCMGAILYVMHGTFASFCELPQIKILLLEKKIKCF